MQAQLTLVNCGINKRFASTGNAGIQARNQVENDIIISFDSKSQIFKHLWLGGKQFEESVLAISRYASIEDGSQAEQTFVALGNGIGLGDEISLNVPMDDRLVKDHTQPFSNSNLV